MNKLILFIFITALSINPSYAWKICGPLGRCCIYKPDADPVTGLPGQLTIACKIGSNAARNSSGGVSGSVNFSSCSEAIASNQLSKEDINFLKSSKHCLPTNVRSVRSQK